MNLHDWELNLVSKQFLDFLSLLPLQWFGDLSISVPENNLASLRKQLDVRVLRRLNTGLSPIHDLSNIDSWQTITALPQKMQALRVVHLLKSLCTIQCLYIIWYILGYYRYNYRYNYRYMFHHKRTNTKWFKKNTWKRAHWVQHAQRHRERERESKKRCPMSAPKTHPHRNVFPFVLRVLRQGESKTK